MSIRFEVLKDFALDHSTYVKGLRYTVRPGNILLERAVRQWVKEGMVRILPQGDARLEGKGERSGPPDTRWQRFKARVTSWL